MKLLGCCSFFFPPPFVLNCMHANGFIDYFGGVWKDLPEKVFCTKSQGGNEKNAYQSVKKNKIAQVCGINFQGTKKGCFQEPLMQS